MKLIGILCGIYHIYVMLDNAIALSATRERIIGPNDYCSREHFNATCNENEVIIIQKALYGRMQIKRCVKLNIGFLGCAANVTAELGSRCSGRRQCVVSVTDDLLYTKNPCVPETVPYLEVTYKCVQVITSSPSSCHRHKALTVREQSGLLSTDPTQRLRQGTHDCPWEISVQPGQKINLTLYSFVDYKGGSNLNKALTDLSDGTCLKVASVHEENDFHKENVEVKKILACLSHLKQRQHVYTSDRNVIRIVIESKSIMPPSAAFLIQFEATGCPNIIPKGKEVVVRTDNFIATIYCNHTKKTWFLTCKGTEWIGESETEKCNDDGGHSGTMFDESSFPYGLLIAVAIGVALGVFCGGMLLTLVAVHNKRRKRRVPSQLMAQQESVYYGTKQEHLEAHQMHQHYEPATHYCTEMSNLTRASNEVNTPILCPNHRHNATTSPNTIVSPDGPPLEFREFCMKPDQQPDLFQLDKNCTLSKDRVKFTDSINQNQTTVR